MRKIIIVGLALLMGLAMVPTAPAQLGGVHGAVCSAGAGGVPLNLLQGSHTGTSFYNDPGSNANVDVFSFCAAEGDLVEFEVDNVDTPSDLWACVTAQPDDSCDPPFYNSFLFDLGGDDEVGCTVPHIFACPAGVDNLPADSGDGVYYIRVGTWASPGGYSGDVTVNGNDVLILPN